MALSLTVLGVVYTLLIGFDENKYIAGFLVNDFSVTDVTTDNVASSSKCYDGITSSFLGEMEKLEGISDYGNVY